MRAQLVVEVYVEFTLNKIQFDLLTEAIKNGEKSHEATIGHFWYGNMNMFNYSDAPYDCFLSCTTRQLDTVILKSIEMLKSYCADEEQKKIYREIWDKLFTLLKMAIEKRNELSSQQTEFEL
jgi:hypothetical protein